MKITCITCLSTLSKNFVKKNVFTLIVIIIVYKVILFFNSRNRFN